MELYITLILEYRKTEISSFSDSCTVLHRCTQRETRQNVNAQKNKVKSIQHVTRYSEYQNKQKVAQQI